MYSTLNHSRFSLSTIMFIITLLLGIMESILRVPPPQKLILDWPKIGTGQKRHALATEANQQKDVLL